MEEKGNFVFYSEPFRWFEKKDKDGTNFYTEGYISTYEVDLVGDIVTKACMADMLRQMKERSIKLDLQHESIVGKDNMERETSKTKIQRARFVDAFIDDKGIFARAQLNRHHTDFKNLWNQIKDGFVDAHSIAYIPTRTTSLQGKGDAKRLLDRLNLINVAYTGIPINAGAGIRSVFAKSLEWLNGEVKDKADRPDSDKGNNGEDPPIHDSDHTHNALARFNKIGGTMTGKTNGDPVDLSAEQKDQIEVKSLATSIEKLTGKVVSLTKDVGTMKKSIEKISKKAEDEKPDGNGDKPEEGSDSGESGSGNGQDGDSSEPAPKEGKALKAEMKAMREEISEMKAALETPVYKALHKEMKSILETAQSETDEKGGPLDIV